MIRRLDISIYHCTAVFLIESGEDEIERFAKGMGRVFTIPEILAIKESCEEGTSCTLPCESLDYMVYIHDKDDMAAVTHELWHLSFDVLFKRGMNPEVCEEPFAYLMGWLCEQFYGQLIKEDEHERDIELGTGQ